MSHSELLGIPIAASTRIDVYSGVARLAGRIWASHHVPPGGPSRTVVAVVHPSSTFLGHYLLAPLARRGIAAAGLNTRYMGNDTALVMENCVLDVGAAVRHLRGLGYERVVLVGNSGGGGLAALYQREAEHPSITSTPAGDPADMAGANLPPVDGLVMLMAHPGRASVYTEWLDPAIRDEADPFDRDPDLDMFELHNGPPYAPDFLSAYRAAQLARNRRITAWVREQLQALERRTGPAAGADDLPFVVHGTTADPRFLDRSVDPSDREPGTLWGDPARANLSPTSLGHLTSLRSWLSQWSIDDSRAHAPSCLSRVSCPVQVIYGTADRACFPSHARQLYEAIAHEDRQLVAIKGADHYFQGQPELLQECVDHLVSWLDDYGWA